MNSFCRHNETFIGSEIVERQRKEGVKRKLVYLSIDEKLPLWGLECVYRNGDIAGYLRRGEYGYVMRKSIGKCFVVRKDGQPIDNEYLRSGKYEIEILGKRYPAKLLSS